MNKFGIEDEAWFQAARTALSQRGFTLRVQPKSIVVEHPARLPRIFGSARDMLEFAQKQGIEVTAGAFRVADLYGDGTTPPLHGRRSPSPFETPPELLGGGAQRDAGGGGGGEQDRWRALEAEVLRLQIRVEEAEKKCALWQMSASAAEDRAQALQAALDSGGGGARGPDPRFEALRRFLARALHPDLAGGDPVARAIREEIFKRVWSKIEELQ